MVAFGKPVASCAKVAPALSLAEEINNAVIFLSPRTALVNSGFRTRWSGRKSHYTPSCADQVLPDRWSHAASQGTSGGNLRKAYKIKLSRKLRIADSLRCCAGGA